MKISTNWLLALVAVSFLLGFGLWMAGHRPEAAVVLYVVFVPAVAVTWRRSSVAVVAMGDEGARE